MTQIKDFPKYKLVVESRLGMAILANLGSLLFGQSQSAIKGLLLRSKTSQQNHKSMLSNASCDHNNTSKVAAGASFLALQLSCRGNAARERIFRDLMAFLEARNELHLLQNLPKTPKGVLIDWLRLYEEVVARGGFDFVSQQKLWGEIISPKCMNIDAMPYVIASYYKRVLFAFEQKQVFGNDVPSANLPHGSGSSSTKRIAVDTDTDDDHGPSSEQIASSSELQDSQNPRVTPLPRATKRLKVQRQLQSDLGILHQLVLLLDSCLPMEVHRAINILNIITYGLVGDSESDISVENIPGLLDAIYRQLQSCHVLLEAPKPDGSVKCTSKQWHARNRLLNLSQTSHSHHVQELSMTKALSLLNIVRNLSMVGENEKPIAQHEDLCGFLIGALRSSHREVMEYSLDTLCNIAKQIDFHILNPIVIDKVYDTPVQANTTPLVDQQMPLEFLLETLKNMLCAPRQPRLVLLRVLELMANVTRDYTILHLCNKSKALHSRQVLNRLVELLATSKQDFHGGSGRRKRRDDGAIGGSRGHSGGWGDESDYEYGDDGIDDDDDDNGDDINNHRWPAPWENDGLPSGIGMGIVYTSTGGGHGNDASNQRHFGVASGASLEEDKLDFEMRDASLEVLYRLSEGDDSAKLRIAQHPHCLSRLAAILTSCIGRPEAARIAVATLSNISMNRDTFASFLAIEKDLILVACSDRSVADILSNMVVDVYGMHSL